MQTLDTRPPVAAPEEIVSPARRRKRMLVLVAAAAALILITVAITYALSGSTTTVVRTVAAPPANPQPGAIPSCVPGAAPGSCNTDEAAEINLKDKPLDAATRAAVAAQLVAARAAAMKYPTVADALRARFIQAGKFSPQTGAHFINIGAYGGTFDASNPGSLIYDGTSPTSKVVGAMYISGSLNPPEGFAGPNDHWHRHANTCVVYQGTKIVIPFVADSTVTKPMCDAQHGQFMRLTVWMVHAWAVPGWESPLGVFSHENPNILCKDGTTKTDSVGFCPGT